jgi:hypothetical protein
MKFLTVFTRLIIACTALAFSVTATAQEQAAAGASASGELAEKCKYPQQPSIPNGTKATMDEMVTAQKAVKSYQAEAQSYRTCVDGVMAAWDSQGGTEEEIGQKKDIAVTFYNRSVADEEEVANLFNSAIRAFKGKTHE